MHSILKKQDWIFRGFQRLSAEPPLKLSNASQIHGANDDVQPTVFVQIGRCRQIPLIAGSTGKRIWPKFVPANVFKKHDAPLGMLFKIRKIAGDQNIEITVLV